MYSWEVGCFIRSSRWLAVANRASDISMRSGMLNSQPVRSFPCVWLAVTRRGALHVFMGGGILKSQQDGSLSLVGASRIHEKRNASTKKVGGSPSQVCALHVFMRRGMLHSKLVARCRT